MMWVSRGAAACCAAVAMTACGGGDTGPGEGQTAPGAPRTGVTAVLETGAAAVQAKPPVDQIALYLVGFHPGKADPQMQMESHHYCDQVNEEFAQCVLYDGNTEHARLHGVEYIISERLYATLPADEKAFWHPHNYEVLSGQLQMPGLPDTAADAALRRKLNSYGKTWHFWKTGVYGEAADEMPFGPPHLAWSFNRDGEAKAGLVETRDERMGLNTAEERRDRQAWLADANPQGGVDAIAGAFADTTPIPGVRDNGETASTPVPTFGMESRQPLPTGR
ncbi:MAG: OBAP family protein [Vicinamibacterales bacterium]